MRTTVALCLALACSCLLVDSAWSSGRLIPAIDPVPAAIEFWAERIGLSDSIHINIMAVTDPGFATSGAWKVDLPEGMKLLSGALEQSGSADRVFGTFGAFVQCEHMGEFKLHGHLFAAHDTSTWIAEDVDAFVYITSDSMEHWRKISRYENVMDGIHYRRGPVWWIPLDPGEDVVVDPSFDYQRPTHPSTSHAERAVRAGAVAEAPEIEVPVVVVVGRNGHVKGAELYGLQKGVPEDAQSAALVAAWKWRFEPALSLGRPVSAVFIIKVPVTGASQK